MTSVAICIATYGRSEGLARLLHSLQRQVFSQSEPEVHIVVVDNDARRSAETVCRGRWARAGWTIDYQVEPERGIPHARNRAVRCVPTATDFIAFLDDDEEAEPNWLDALLTAQARNDADVVAGPVVPSYAPDVPEWVVRGRFFQRPHYPSGQKLEVAFTCNVLVRSAVLREQPGPFDQRFRLNGGDDSHLFRRLAQSGCHMAWTDTAVVTESIPASKGTLGWLIRRGFRTGNAMAAIAVDLATSLWIYPLTAGKGFTWLAIGTAALPLSLATGRRGLAKSGRLLAYGAGLLTGLLGVRYQEYRRTHGG